MKIIFFTMTLTKGGAERVITTLCNNWKVKSDELVILTCLKDKPQYAINERIEVMGLVDSDKYYKRGKIKTFKKLCYEYKKAINKINPEIVISFLPEPCMISTIMNRGRKTVIVGSERGNPYYQYSWVCKLLMNWVYSHMDGVVFQTTGARKYFNKKVQRKGKVIGNPISNRFIKTATRIPCRNEIVSVGRFTPEKNYPVLIKAFGKVLNKYPNLVLKIYGRVDKSLKIDELITDLNIGNSVILMGESDCIQDDILNAGIFVMSSKSEGMPNALMEAMALGLPVISTDCPPGGPKELIKNNENGILVSNENVDELAKAIIKLVGDEDLADQLGKKASEIVNEYATDVICNKWSSYINDLIKEIN